MQVVKINVETRDLGRKKASNQLRKEGFVPAVLYGGKDVHHIKVNPSDVRPLVYTHEFKIAEIVLDGTSHKCILKSIQFHPVTDEIVHMDFLKIIDGHPIKVNIPLHFEGTPIGVSNGGRLVKELRRIEVKVLPSNLVDHMSIDVSKMKMGDSLRVRDIDTEDGVEILLNEAIPVAVVQTPRALLKATTTDVEGEEEGEEGVEGAEEETTETEETAEA